MLLYRILAVAALLAYAPVAWLRSLRGRRRLGDVRGRLGRSAWPDLDGGIWIHAVSVGEVGVARNLVAAIRRSRPGTRIGVSTTTAAGRELAEKTLSRDAAVFAFPFDLAGPVERSLDQTRPGLVLLTETEIWPLFLERAARRGIPVALVNGRISERSFRRYRRVRGFMGRVLSRVALFAMQSPEDARRVVDLGGLPERVHVTGNVKYDLPEPAPFPDAERLRSAAAGRPVVVAGSTAEGEDEIVLEAWSRLSPRPLLLLAPRRPERFDEAARLAESRGLTVFRRSHPASRVPDPARVSDVYILDTIGELASAYREAAVAFVGGSLAPRGGQNPIEAWAAGTLVVAGPHMENFREIAAAGEARGILVRVPDASGLADALAAALGDAGKTRDLGRRAADFVSESRGAAERTVDAALALASPAARRGAAS
ncbi:MAG TPA: glycosyltransferase N-terminal domain-containing protein [Thermoanaerobaculia bacterium]|nr:glycosyltransferase N-terminal domain-containing protein [Thermoanaerobaculia bacterium]